MMNQDKKLTNIFERRRKQKAQKSGECDEVPVGVEGVGDIDPVAPNPHKKQGQCPGGKCLAIQKAS